MMTQEEWRMGKIIQTFQSESGAYCAFLPLTVDQPPSQIKGTAAYGATQEAAITRLYERQMTKNKP